MITLDAGLTPRLTFKKTCLVDLREPQPQLEALVALFLVSAVFGTGVFVGPVTFAMAVLAGFPSGAAMRNNLAIIMHLSVVVALRTSQSLLRYHRFTLSVNLDFPGQRLFSNGS